MKWPISRKRLALEISVALLVLASPFYIGSKLILPHIASSQDLCFQNPDIQEAMETNDYLHFYIGDDEDVALKYLKLAHAITTKFLTVEDDGDTGISYEMLETRVGNCDETSRLSYSNFLYLADSLGKPELKDYVRLANGDAHTEEVSGGHMWLEVYQDGSWLPYETTMNDLPEDQKINPGSIDELVVTDDVLALDGWEYVKTNSNQITSEGVLVRDVHLWGVLKAKGSYVFLDVL